jgi:hypothetical protein
VSADRSDRGLIVGLIILLVGLVLLVDRADLFRVSLGGALFGLTLLVVGLYLLLTRYREGRLDRLFLPSVLVLFGVLSVVEELTRWNAMEYFVPLLLVLLGLGYMTRPWRRERSRTPPTG